MIECDGEPTLRHVRLAAGWQEELVSSPDHSSGYSPVDTCEGGIHLGPGVTADLPQLTCREGDTLHYWLRCEDGQAVDFELGLMFILAPATNPLVDALLTRSTVRELSGSTVLKRSGTIIARLDNSRSWFSTRSVHVELRVGRRMPRRPVDDARDAATRRRRERVEESALREAHTAELHDARSRLESEVARLEGELSRARDELVRVREVIASAPSHDEGDGAGVPDDDEEEVKDDDDDDDDEETPSGAVVRHLRLLWRLLSQLDPAASVTATWVGPADLVLREVVVHGVALEPLEGGAFTVSTDCRRVLGLCMRALAESRSASGASSPAAARDADGAGADTDGTHAEHRTALSQLHRLSEMILEIDPRATMEVSPISDGEYELSAVRVGGHVFEGFGSVFASTRVEDIAAVCRATAAQGRQTSLLF